MIKQDWSNTRKVRKARNVNLRHELHTWCRCSNAKGQPVEKRSEPRPQQPYRQTRSQLIGPYGILEHYHKDQSTGCGSGDMVAGDGARCASLQVDLWRSNSGTKCGAHA